uniref:Replication protein A 70 kDa DNA-binding subunit B/D first OB fold domain-containing protein n=1 Tax=Aegilops tauschii subsp. strangulata TaxID=200361 RepID=A0A453C8R3_AEGTS
MAYDMLDAINNGKDSWKVKVRVIRLWDAINLNNNELISLDMILLDEHGTMIHAKVIKHMVNKFRPLIQEGLVYMIANFKVTSAMNFRPVEGDKIINFLHTTKIQEIKGLKNIRIAEQSFMFCSVEVLSTRDGQRMYLSADVIGVASYIGNIEETGTTHGISKIRDIVLRIEDQKVNIRLWGNKVDQIDEDSMVLS